MADREVFRIFFWQKVTPLLVLPVLLLMFMASPIDDGWTQRTWTIAAAVGGTAIAFYLLMHWRNSDVVLDDRGMTYHGRGARETRGYDKLLNVRQIGKYRVKLCFDPGIPDKHWHVTFDLWNSDAFVDALLDRYEESTGHELELNEHEAAA